VTGSRAAAKVAVIVQARMSSSRLPGKVLKDLGPGTAIDLLARRLGGLSETDTVVIATSVGSDDDPIADRVEGLGLHLFRGPLDDVLERYRLAAAHVDCDAVVRITSDCPLAEPEVIDTVIRLWRGRDDLAYAWNTRAPRSFPDGLDVEVVSRAALEEAAAESRDPYDREHVTPFVRDRPERFPQQSLRLEPPVRNIKLALDTPEDLATIRSFLRRVGPDADLQRILEAAGGGPSRMVVE
jgi:spore coat polysaccharide biosynthesis protein SpsF (cytidylyltransferase family)